ncbi:MAG: glycerate kinase [Anaerolineae bacterium]|nr:glycerate kinase [Anaerolineae bacterium]
MNGSEARSEGSHGCDTKVPRLRRDLAEIRDAALAAVDPYAVVKRFMRRQADRLFIADRSWAVNGLNAPGRISVLAVGKAAVPMARAACEVLGEALAGGVVVTKYGHASAHSLPQSLTVIEAGHPIPDTAGLAGGRACIEHLQGATERDLVILLLSGGGSALLPAPVPGVTLEDLQALTGVLLRAGANIVEINAVRKHLSQIKGGQLARHAAPAQVVALILSDVVGDPLDVIASGPTAPDPATYQDAWDVLARYGALEEVPHAIVAHLEQGLAGDIPETPKPGDARFEAVRNIIIGSNSLAAEEAVACAEALGYRSLLLTTFVEGEAREVAKVAAALALGLRRQAHPFPPPACLVWGGETTVTVKGSGKGGRNQELALAAALAMEGLEDVAMMALATDGTDGPTDAAGAVVDGATAQRAREAGWDPYQALLDNNAYPLLAATGDLLLLGPTGTNVNDLLVLLAL